MVSNQLPAQMQGKTKQDDNVLLVHMPATHSTPSNSQIQVDTPVCSLTPGTSSTQIITTHALEAGFLLPQLPILASASSTLSHFLIPLTNSPGNVLQLPAVILPATSSPPSQMPAYYSLGTNPLQVQIPTANSYSGRDLLPAQILVACASPGSYLVSVQKQTASDASPTKSPSPELPTIVVNDRYMGSSLSVVVHCICVVLS